MSDETDQLAVHEVRFRYNDLNEDNTYYDQVIAAPIDRHRRIQWSMWLSTALFVAIFVAIVFIAVVTNKQVRSKSFNLYLIFLMIPDFLFSFLCVLNCILNLAVNDYFSERWCHFQSFYCIWGIGANAWLNSVVAYHMHHMLLNSSRRQNYQPPQLRGVVISSLAAYGWAFFVAMWPFIDFLPHETGLLAGLACFPVVFDGNSMMFFFLVFFPCFALIPLLYVIYVWASVTRNNLLPNEGKTRLLAMYFFRLILIFIVMWLPSLFLLFGTSGLLNPWFMGIGGSWSHLQGAASAVASLMKPDIRKAVMAFVFCQKPQNGEREGDRSRVSTVKSMTIGQSYASNRLPDIEEEDSQARASSVMSGTARSGQQKSLRSAISVPSLEDDGYNEVRLILQRRVASQRSITLRQSSVSIDEVQDSKSGETDLEARAGAHDDVVNHPTTRKTDPQIREDAESRSDKEGLKSNPLSTKWTDVLRPEEWNPQDDSAGLT